MSRSSHSSGVVIVACFTLVFCTGCPFMLSGEYLSSLILQPDSSCQEIAQQLDLGTVRLASIPQDVDLAFEPFTVSSANGATLTGWFIPAQRGGIKDSQPLGTVFLNHGTDGTIACALPWASVAALNGFHAVLFDYQGFGDSEGTANLATMLDDSDAVMQWIVDDPEPARQKVHLLGVSLGTGATFGLAALRGRPQIQSVMVEGAFDPRQQQETLAAGVATIFPLAGESAESAFPWLFEMRANLGEVSVPVMFINSELDGITPVTGATAMSKLLPAALVDSWLFGGMGHVQPLFKLTANYVSLAVTFWRNPNATANPDASVTDSTIRVPVLLE